MHMMSTWFWRKTGYDTFGFSMLLFLPDISLGLQPPRVYPN
jgi:hypothetical protein